MLSKISEKAKELIVTTWLCHDFTSRAYVIRTIVMPEVFLYTFAYVATFPSLVLVLNNYSASCSSICLALPR